MTPDSEMMVPIVARIGRVKRHMLYLKILIFLFGKNDFLIWSLNFDHESLSNSGSPSLNLRYDSGISQSRVRVGTEYKQVGTASNQPHRHKDYYTFITKSLPRR